ncbi:MAG TPA: DUF1572 family protein [Opitutaceae bacterium]|nr:DUF1572 family protein [Opitutaceae bacterium]
MPAPESHLQSAVREFRQLKSLGDRAIAQVSDDHFFAAPGPGDNSIAVMVKHVGGNLVSRWTDFLTSDGEKAGRNRDNEFEILPGDTREALLRQWEAGWAALFAALEPLGDADLSRTVIVRREPLTVFQAINRQLTHYAYHVGQIVYVAKHHCGPAWRTLSIPRGGSAAFNQNPRAYIPRT